MNSFIVYSDSLSKKLNAIIGEKTNKHEDSFIHSNSRKCHCISRKKSGREKKFSIMIVVSYIRVFQHR
mgnify:CR=1 FL=1